MTLRDALSTQYTGGLIAGTVAGMGVLAWSLTDTAVWMFAGAAGSFVATYFTARAARRALSQFS
jgi:hypothetical protein